MALKQMKDSDMPLIDRINAALNRIHLGHAAMRIPAEATDHDVVLADCKERIAELEKAIQGARELMRELWRAEEIVSDELAARCKGFMGGG